MASDGAGFHNDDPSPDEKIAAYDTMASQRFVIRAGDQLVLDVPLTMVGYLAQMAGHGETADLVPGEGDRRIDAADEADVHVEIVNGYF